MTVVTGPVRVECESQAGHSAVPARIEVFLHGIPCAIIEAHVELTPGADGRQYPCVELKSVPIP